MSALDLARSDWPLEDVAAIDWVKLSLQLALGDVSARKRYVARNSRAAYDRLEAEVDLAIMTGDNAAALRAIESFRSEAAR